MRAMQARTRNQLGFIGCKPDGFFLTGISFLAPNSPTLYAPLGTPAPKISSFGRAQGSGQSPDYANASPQLLVAAFPSGFVRHPSVPLLALDRFPGSRSPGYPAGSDSTAIRRTILPKSRLVRWLSARKSQ